MQVLDIVQYPDERLRQVAEPVVEFNEELQDQVQSMILTCQVYMAHGLAAPQVGINKRIYVARAESGDVEVYINPKIVEKIGTAKGREGCLSFPGVIESVERAEDITLTYQTIEGEERTVAMSDMEAVAAQHELDHLDGILFIDRVGRLTKKLMLKRLEKSRSKQTSNKAVSSKRAAARKERKRQKKHRRAA